MLLYTLSGAFDSSSASDIGTTMTDFVELLNSYAYSFCSVLECFYSLSISSADVEMLLALRVFFLLAFYMRYVFA